MGVERDDELGLWLALGWNEMWTSPDGDTWTRHEFDCQICADNEARDGSPYAAYMTGVTRRGDTLYAAGVAYLAGDSRELLLWTSSDGATWTEVPHEDSVWSVSFGVATNGTVLAVATSYFAVPTGAVLTSVSGASWDEQQPGGTASMLGIYADADGFVAVGYREPNEGSNVPVIWISPDGSSWTDASPAGASGMLVSVTRAASGAYVAAGMASDGSLVVWWSRDGVGWLSTTIDADMPAQVGWPDFRLATSDDSIALLAATGAGWTTWASEDGFAWDQAGSFVGPSTATYTGFALSEGKAVAFVGFESQLWLGTFSRSAR
jgi:hypothetical protein